MSLYKCCSNLSVINKVQFQYSDIVANLFLNDQDTSGEFASLFILIWGQYLIEQ